MIKLLRSVEVLVHFLGFLLFGTLIGVTVRMLVAKRAGGWGISILSGAFGALLGGFLGRSAGFHRDLDSAGFVMSVLGAFSVVVLYHAVAAMRRVQT
jgi:uncharacterized membrane protein YeaQ/YmgE (transglycosylase-associated protein family)